MKKIIITSVTSAILIAIAITTLVLALIPVNHNNLIEKPYIVYIMNQDTKDNTEDDGICKLKSYTTNYDNEAEKIDKIYSLFNENFGQKLLTAIFRGEVNNKMTSDFTPGGTASISKNYNTKEKYTIVFEYKTEPDPKDSAKEIYHNFLQHEKAGKGGYGYKYIFFELVPGDARQEITFGVSQGINFSTYTDRIEYRYSYKCVANLSNVYDYVSKLDIKK